MPGQHTRQRAGLRKGTGRGGIPHPGEGGYDYPPGPFGATGFPGSTAAARGRTKRQDAEGRKDRQLNASQIRDRDTGPEFADVSPVEVPRPQPPYGSVRFRPGAAPAGGNRYLRPDGSPRQPRARQMRSTATERRMTPVIGALGLFERKPPRNQVAQRWRAVPGMIRAYQPAPNPGKTGAHLAGPSQYHPGTIVWGAPDGKPIPGMDSNPGPPPEVIVSSRYVSHEGAQEGYAVNRPLAFTKGGNPNNYPPGYLGNRHLRGGRMTGQRYFGALEDQQRIGAAGDSYGIQRKRGPRHRPVRFELPAPWTANYYDVAPEHGRQDPDMIHRSPAERPRSTPAKRAARGPRRTGRG